MNRSSGDSSVTQNLLTQSELLSSESAGNKVGEKVQTEDR